MVTEHIGCHGADSGTAIPAPNRQKEIVSASESIPIERAAGCIMAEEALIAKARDARIVEPTQMSRCNVR
jgi:hypothetical protein